MADIFKSADLRQLFEKKYVLLFGCSNTRAVYKDLVCLWQSNSLVSDQDLKRKLEPSYLGDHKKKGDKLIRGRDYEEEREFKKDGVHIEFRFITKCFATSLKEVLNDIRNKKHPPPDVLLLSSALWDITRWGPNGVQIYRDEMVKLMQMLKKCLPEETLVIWTTAPPVAGNCYGGLFVKQVEFMKHFLRFEIMEANMFARQLVVSYGFDILDIHYYLRMQIHMRAKDGIHWLPIPVRLISNLILTHIALSWNYPLPGNFYGVSLDRMKSIRTVQDCKENVPPLPDVPVGLLTNTTPARKFHTPKQIKSPSVESSPFRLFLKEKLKKRRLELSPSKNSNEQCSTIVRNNKVFGCRETSIRNNNIEDTQKKVVVNSELSSSGEIFKNISVTFRIQDMSQQTENYRRMVHRPKLHTVQDYSRPRCSPSHGPLRIRETYRYERRRRPYYCHPF